MSLPRTKQVSLILPREVLQRAERLAKVKTRPDGMRLSVAAIIRGWAIKGMASDGR